jgi:hypothetical protein
MSTHASPELLKEIEHLLATHDLYSGDFERLWDILEGARIAEEADKRGVERDGSHFPLGQALQTLAWLKRQIADGTTRRFQ